MTKFVIRPARAIGNQSLGNVASGLVVAAIIILFLYLGREILEPLVIAALLSFVLVPRCQRPQGKGWPPLGQKVFDAAKAGTITTISYNFPKPGGTDPVPKEAFVTAVGNQGRGVDYYK